MSFPSDSIATLQDPRGGVVTIRPTPEGTFERTVTYPDGSSQAMTFARLSDMDGLTDGPPQGTGTVGGDAAARRLAETAVGTLLYCHATRTWLAWDGAVWRRDGTGVVQRLIRATLREAGVADPGPRLVAGVETFARCEAALVAPDPSAFDADPWRLATPGGTVDLATGTLRPAEAADRITRATAVAPAETADCPIWLRFLGEAMGGDADMVLFLQRYLGYALTGETREHALVYGIGDGGNGKSVLVNTVRGIMGDYAMVAAPDLFTQGSRRDGSTKSTHSTEIAMLAGARLVVASETDEARVWSDGRLKLLTGGDPVTARHVGRDPITFTPRFKLLAVGNHMPLLRTVDAAISRRLCLVPFATRPIDIDRTLEAKLRAEWPAILRWMIEGCLGWQAHGLARPHAVRDATMAYLGGQDLVGQFLCDACEIGPAHEETAAALYTAWCRFAKAAGEMPGTARLFAGALDRHGFTRERTAHARVYRGVRVRG